MTSGRPAFAGDEIPIERVRLGDWVRTYGDDHAAWSRVHTILKGVHTASGRRMIELRAQADGPATHSVAGFVNGHRVEAATPAQARRADWYPEWARREAVSRG